MSKEYEALLLQIEALLKLDARNALVPHGIGGHARELLAKSSEAVTDLETRVGELREALTEISSLKVTLSQVETGDVFSVLNQAVATARRARAATSGGTGGE